MRDGVVLGHFLQDLAQIDRLVKLLVEEAWRRKRSHLAHSEVVRRQFELGKRIGEALMRDALGALRFLRFVSAVHHDGVHGR